MACAVVYYYHEPGALDFTIKQRGSWSFSFTVYESDGITPFDLTGYVGRCEFVRQDTLALVATVTVSIPDPTDGTIFLSLTDTQTDALDPAVPMFYDVFVDNGTDDRCFLQGAVTIAQGYTAL